MKPAPSIAVVSREYDGNGLIALSGSIKVCCLRAIWNKASFDENAIQTEKNLLGILFGTLLAEA